MRTHATDVSLYGGLDLQAARNLIGQRDRPPNTLPSAPILTNGLFVRWSCEIKQDDLQHRRSRGCRLFNDVIDIIKKKREWKKNSSIYPTAKVPTPPVTLKPGGDTKKKWNLTVLMKEQVNH